MTAAAKLATHEAQRYTNVATHLEEMARRQPDALAVAITHAAAYRAPGTR